MNKLKEQAIRREIEKQKIVLLTYYWLFIAAIIAAIVFIPFPILVMIVIGIAITIAVCHYIIVLIMKLKGWN